METLDLKATRTTVLQTEDINDLYSAEMDLTEYIGQQHKNISLAQSKAEQDEARSNLSIANSLVGICRDRQKEVRDLNNKFNYHFRTAARVMLTKETYDAIVEKAYLPRKEFKSMSRELNKQKLQ